MSNWDQQWYEWARQWWMFAGSIAFVAAWRMTALWHARRRIATLGEVRCRECGHEGTPGTRGTAMRVDIVCDNCKGYEIRGVPRSVAQG